MLESLKQVIQQIGQGLTAQHMGEMSATAHQIERQNLSTPSSGRQSRVVLITSNDPLVPAFDYTTSLSRQTRSVIEVLYINPADKTEKTVSAVSDV